MTLREIIFSGSRPHRLSFAQGFLKRSGLRIASGAAACLFILVGCSEKTEGVGEEEYGVMVIKKDSAYLESEYSARLAGKQQVEIRPQVSGLITRICLREGEKVKKGQLLFVIDQAPYVSALKEAEANVKVAESALDVQRLTTENQQKLYDSGVIGSYELSSAKMNLAAAEASLEAAKAQAQTARTNLGYTEVRSPVDGKAGMISYRVGSLVSSSIEEPLVVVSDESQVSAYFSITEKDMMALMEKYGSQEALIEGLPEVGLRLANGGIYALKGRIEAVSGIVSEDAGSVSLRADFPNPGGILMDGGSGSVVLPSVLEDCIVIPQAATYELQDRMFAYKVVQGKATSVGISVFRLNDGKEYVVESGLEVGDTIIADGAGLVKEGEVIKNTKP